MSYGLRDSISSSRARQETSKPDKGPVSSCGASILRTRRLLSSRRIALNATAVLSLIRNRNHRSCWCILEACSRQRGEAKRVENRDRGGRGNRCLAFFRMCARPSLNPFGTVPTFSGQTTRSWHGIRVMQYQACSERVHGIYHVPPKKMTLEEVRRREQIKETLFQFQAMPRYRGWCFRAQISLTGGAGLLD